MVRRRCLDCPRFIQTRSRCPACTRQHERTRRPQRSAYARTTWPQQVKARDGYRCRVPGCTTPTDRIQAHHLHRVADGGADTLENGITLCWQHHQRQHGGR